LQPAVSHKFCAIFVRLLCGFRRGQAEPGERVAGLSVAMTAAGQWRVRTSRGWLSTVSSYGEQILQAVPDDAASDGWSRRQLDVEVSAITRTQS
jgi:hypothetical protein